MRKKKEDIKGNRYGKLVALYAVSESDENGGAEVWRCRCDCGSEINVLYPSLISGNKKSCGCLKEESQQNLLERLELVDGTCVEWLEGRKRRVDNKSGCKGVFRKKSGKYTVSIGFKKKVLYLGTCGSRDEAVEKSKTEQDPDWVNTHPFRFDVEKREGEIVIISSMKDYLDSVSGCNVTVI